MTRVVLVSPSFTLAAAPADDVADSKADCFAVSVAMKTDPRVHFIEKCTVKVPEICSCPAARQPPA